MGGIGAFVSFGVSAIKAVKTVKQGITIGKDMAKVKNATTLNNTATYKAMKVNKAISNVSPKLANKISLAHNTTFINRMVKLGVPIYDNGLSGAESAGKWYGIELSIVSGYSNYDKMCEVELMNKKKLIQNNFAFLKKYGFEFTYSKSDNIIFNYCFSNSNTFITIHEDYTHEFVALNIKKGNNTILEILDGNFKLNEIFIGYAEMMESIKKIYSEALEKNWSISELYFKSIIGLYSEFIEINFSKISS